MLCLASTSHSSKSLAVIPVPFTPTQRIQLPIFRLLCRGLDITERAEAIARRTASGPWSVTLVQPLICGGLAAAAGGPRSALGKKRRYLTQFYLFQFPTATYGAQKYG